MNVSQTLIQYPAEIDQISAAADPDAHLILAFGSIEAIEDPAVLSALKTAYPRAKIAGSSGASQIHGSEVFLDSLTIAAIRFDDTTIKTRLIELTPDTVHLDAGREMGEFLDEEDLAYTMVFVDGLVPNCDDIVRGLRSAIGQRSAISGGRAADNWKFERTAILSEDGAHHSAFLAVGFYGEKITAKASAVSGWPHFGGTATITKSVANQLLEIDDDPALEVFKRHLGPEANSLPNSGLNFPLQIIHENGLPGLIRTPFGIDEESNSFFCAGDVPEGDIRMLVFSSVDDLVEAASKAAGHCPPVEGKDNLAILFTCAARREVMGPATELEVEAIFDKFGREVPCLGFYAYGEICDFDVTNQCELHNQTMTVTMLSEG